MTTERLYLPRDHIRILLLEGISDRARAAFAERGYTNVRVEAGALSHAALLEAVADVHLLGIRSRTQVNGEVLDAARLLMGVGCFCIGTNQVELVEAAHRGVPVFNAPHSNTRSVAELVIGLAVMLFRDVFRKSTTAHAGGWLKSAQGAHELRGHTLGIVGYGHIGSQVSVLAEAMGMHVIFHDVQPVLAMGNAAARASLGEVLTQSDLVTLHVPETPQTACLIGAAELARMKPGAHLINASRGTVVDDEALAAALTSGHLAGAAVDVFPREPRSERETFESPLRGIPNVILTPHVGGSTLEAQDAIAADVAAKLAAYSDSGTTTAAVNFPQLGLTPHEDCHRVLHIHRNVPGVLASINAALSAQGTNILGQHLQTQNGVGYVVTDVSAIDADAILPQLKAIAGTLRARVLY
ncbi:MAG: phosphoglycerate dehydrogenase [Planctomycetota bacterium]|nr:phosphoglycerate dehydrogenase [Planctomycetota bacterium]